MVRLVIVESPGKMKTVSDILARLFGKGRYRVLASYGHIRDLPDDALGVDVAAGFRPRYVISPEKRAVLKRLQAAVKEADTLYLASDPDREGESIAWHLVQTLKPSCPVKRVTFNAITEEAIKEGFEKTRPIDTSLVAAQETRRILDRLVGYKISPLLWDNLPNSKGLSAGRAQSAALRLVVERQQAIDAFQPKSCWAIVGHFAAAYGSFEAKLYQWKGQDCNSDQLLTQEGADSIMKAIDGVGFKISKLEQYSIPKHPPAPFTTATLLQAAATHLSLSPDQTMEAAQKLYEAGHITYIRTDSPAIAPEALRAARQDIESRYGDQYLAAKPRLFKSKDSLEEAHECIRPTHIERDSLPISDAINETATTLYSLIWQRFMACQMADAIYNQTIVQVSGGDAAFQGISREMIFDGFWRVYRYGDDVEAAVSSSHDPAMRLPLLIEAETVQADQISSQHHMTEPPRAFSEAGLIKELEARRVGRPSTFASTITALKMHGYVSLIGKRLSPTETGVRLLDFLVKHFPKIFEVEFTARMETALDEIAISRQTAPLFLEDFWREFEPLLATIGKPAVKASVQRTEIMCPRCGSELIVRTKKDRGQFLGCSAFPRCRYSRGVDAAMSESKPEKCPQCGKPLVTRSSKKGAFVGCSDFPACRFTRSL
jgi:DNA topoisomerase I